MILTEEEEERIKSNIVDKSLSSFKSKGNLKIYENIDLNDYKHYRTRPFGKLCTSIVYNQFSQLKKTDQDFTLYVGYIFSCQNFFDMGEYKKKVCLYSLDSRENMLCILRKIKSVKKLYLSINCLISNNKFCRFSRIFFTYAETGLDDGKHDLSFTSTNSNHFIEKLKFLQNSYFSFLIFEQNDPSLFLEINTGMDGIHERVQKMQRLETVTVQRVKVIEVEKDKTTFNGEESFKSEECVICHDEKPTVMFCSCGHIAICTKCNELNDFKKCPVCRKENYVKRKLTELETKK